MTDFEQYRRELTKKLAYQYWERRGRPLGSPDVDWSSAEKAIDPYLLALGQEFRLSKFVWSQMSIRFADPWSRQFLAEHVNLPSESDAD
jgi:Protein of unknown function (DUF2934)